MKLSKIELSVKKVLEEIAEKKLPKGSWPSDATLTSEIKNKIRKIGKENNYLICGHGKEWPGWLFDMAWLCYEGDDLVEVFLVLECEWNPNSIEIDDDFLKLMIAKAKHRVMIFQKKSGEELKGKIDDFKRRILKYKGTKKGDRYLFAGLNWNTGLFEFELFIAK